MTPPIAWFRPSQGLRVGELGRDFVAAVFGRELGRRHSFAIRLLAVVGMKPTLSRGAQERSGRSDRSVRAELERTTFRRRPVVPQIAASRSHLFGSVRKAGRACRWRPKHPVDTQCETRSGPLFGIRPHDQRCEVLQRQVAPLNPTGRIQNENLHQLGSDECRLDPRWPRPSG